MHQGKHGCIDVGASLSLALHLVAQLGQLAHAVQIRRMAGAYELGAQGVPFPFSRVPCGLGGGEGVGAAVDAEGHLWVALVMKGQLARFRPDGSLERLLDLPTPHPSCPCFGGPDLDTLYVTSLSDTGNTIKTDDPRAGRLLAVRGTGARGLPEARFADRA